MNSKRMPALILAAAVLITSVLFSFTAFADDVTWNYDDATATLYITGTGNMEDYEDEGSAPWYIFVHRIKNIVIEEGVTSVGDYAFSGASNLINVSIADTVTSIGKYSFSSCSSLSELSMGANIIEIADTSFAYDGITAKQDFVLKTVPGSYPLYFAIEKSVAYECPSVSCGEYDVSINADMAKAYFPYVAKVSGTFRFYSTSTQYDTYGELYSADNSNPANLTRIRYNDDGGEGVNFSITEQLTKGQTYYFCAFMESGKIHGSFKVKIEPVEYTVSGTVNAMGSPDGEASDIVLTSALMDGELTDGSFSLTVSGERMAVFSYENASVEYTFSPDAGDDIRIPLMVCDVNNDGWVNAKDYAIMKKNASPFIDLYGNFMNYRV